MGRDRAAYMRDYRAKLARERADREMDLVMRTGTPDLRAAQQRIRELEEEVRHLKAELAKRPTEDVKVYLDTPAERLQRAADDIVQFNSRPFTPVPKKGK